MVRRVLLQALFVLGVICFVGRLVLPYTGTWLNRVELPAFFWTSAIALPDGGYLTATIPTSRVQRYGSDGRFRNGWFVDANGFAIGLTSDGKVAVCTDSGSRMQIFIFELDGRTVGGPKPCLIRSDKLPSILQQADFPQRDLILMRATPADLPSPSVVPILLVPFWHPFIPVLMVMVAASALAKRRDAT